MRTFAFKKTRALLVLVVASAGMVLVGSSASAAPVTINLCAVAGTVALPGSVTAPIWGFAQVATSGACTGATPTLPGPVLTVNEGDVVTVNVTNALPGTRTLTFEAPGVAFNAGPTDAATGATVTRSFTAVAGTYLYQSSGDAGRQEAMGLYGALVVNSAAAGTAYGAGTEYNVSAPLVLSQVDVAFNAAPDTFNLYTYNATYWLINGQAYAPPAAPPGITAAGGQKLLLRYLNAGNDNTSMLLLGLHQHVVARSARLLNNPFDADAETIPAGGTEDAIVTLPATLTPPSTNGYPLYNRQLHLTNGPLTTPTPANGGAVIFIHS